MRSFSFLPALLLLACFLLPSVLADEPTAPPAEPQSKPAQAALASLREANKAATDKMDTEVGLARKEYLAKLQAALDTAMTADNLEEANGIKAEMDRVSKGDEEAGGKPKAVAALEARQRYDSAVRLAKGERRRSEEGAVRRCIAQLQAAIPVALKSKDLDEANRINAEIALLKNASASDTSYGEGGLVAPPDLRGLKFEWFNGQDFEIKAGERIDYKVSSCFGDGSAGTNGGRDNFSARWSGFIRAPRPGRYKLMGIADEGFRMKLNGKLVADGWRTTGVWQTAIVDFSGEPQEFLFEMREDRWWAFAAMLWLPPGENTPVVVPPTAFYQTKEAARAGRSQRTPGTGLAMTVFGDQNLDKQIARGIDDNIDWCFDRGPVATGLPVDHFSIRWEGFIVAPTPGVYHFTSNVDDGVRLWIDHKILMDAWRGGNQTVTAELGEGPHEIIVEYYENWGIATISLHWSQADGFDEQIIPPSAFFLTRTAAEQAIAKRKEAEKK